MNICASVASTNAVAMPISATTHIQKIAPGPPAVNAIATPVMLPVPTLDESPMANAWKLEMPPSAFLRELPMMPHIRGNSRIWTNFVLIVK